MGVDEILEYSVQIPNKHQPLLGFLLTGIGLALATIVRVLRWQSRRLVEVLDSTTTPRG
ncbi:MAG: hypothetical protein HYX93_00535 [Chloroflexi bacterium]|nr:hypothetical protein [Chloroflexota bacterium]